MSTIGGDTYLTLTDHARLMDPDGKVAKIVDTLSVSNEIVDAMLWKEGNLPTGEQTTIVTGYPSTAWRHLNYGYQPSKMTTKQITDTCGMLGTFGEVDKKVAGLNGNTMDFRMKQDQYKLKALSKDFATALIYGNIDTDPEQIMGLAPRYALSTATNGTNILKGGGSGSANTSIWLVNWGDEGAFGVFPKGSKAGIESTDLGQQVLEDAAGGKYIGYQNHYEWDCGLTVKDWRNIVRICNVDVSALTADAATGADVIELMIKATHKQETGITGKTEFYCNRTVFTYLDLQTYNSSNMNVSYEKDPHGRRVMMFRGFPVKRVDAILDTEATVA